jgi:hypothetical protein
MYGVILFKPYRRKPQGGAIDMPDLMRRFRLGKDPIPQASATVNNDE